MSYPLPETLAEALEVIDHLRGELAKVCVAVGRSKDGTGYDVDWYELHKDIRPAPEVQAWVALEDRLPENAAICLITDGKDVALAIAGREKWQRDGIGWHGCGFGGHEWEWDFKPTHWKPLTCALPQRVQE